MIDKSKYPRIVKQEYLTFDRDYDEDRDDRWTLAAVLEHAQSVMNRYGKTPEDLMIDFNNYYDDPRQLEIIFERFETDDEYADRIKRQIAYEAKREADRRRKKRSQEEKDLAKLAELRKKYPDA